MRGIKPRKVIFSTYLPYEQVELLHEMAEKRDVSAAKLVREAVTHYLAAVKDGKIEEQPLTE